MISNNLPPGAAQATDTECGAETGPFPGAIHSDLLTSSRLKDGRACARLHHIRYELGYSPVGDVAVLRFGRLWHAGLEEWWRAVAVRAADPLEPALARVRTGDADPFERAKAEALLVGYAVRWLDEPYDVIAVESEFRGPLRNPATGAASRTWRLGGKLDVLVRDRRDGLVRLMEHKSASEDISPGSEYWKRLRMDGQVSVYYEGARLLGYDVAGCIYDVAGKPALRPGQVPVLDEAGLKIVRDAAGERVRTKDGKRWRQTGDTELGYTLLTRDETPDEYRARLLLAVSAEPDRYFQRGEVVRLEAEAAEGMADVWQIGQVIRENQLARRWPRNPDACVRFGRTCPFFSVCTGEASLDDPTKFTRLANVHPELSAVDGAQARPEEEAHQP